MLSSQLKLSLSYYSDLYDMIVPKDHILRKIRELVDFFFIYDELKNKYCLDNGRNAKNPILLFKYLLLKYILLFEHIVLNDITRDYFLSYGPYVTRGPEKVAKARKECYPHIESVFLHYNLPADETTMSLYVITSDAMIKALFTGIVNGSLDITLKEALSYFGRHVILPSFMISEENYEIMVERAFLLADGITLSHSIAKNDTDASEEAPSDEE